MTRHRYRQPLREIFSQQTGGEDERMRIMKALKSVEKAETIIYQIQSVAAADD